MAHNRVKITGAPAFECFTPSHVAFFFHVGVDAYHRARDRDRDKEPEKFFTSPNESAIAIVFSVMSLEALIRLIDFLAVGSRAVDSVAGKMAANAGKSDAGGGTNYSGTRGLYRCLGDASNNPFDEGKGPWLEFRNLLELRHAMTHYNEYTGVHHLPLHSPESQGIHAICIQKNVSATVYDILHQYDLLTPGAGCRGTEWFQDLKSPGTEEWACRAASTMAIEALSKASFLDREVADDLRRMFDFPP